MKAIRIQYPPSVLLPSEDVSFGLAFGLVEPSPFVAQIIANLVIGGRVSLASDSVSIGLSPATGLVLANTNP